MYLLDTNVCIRFLNKRSQKITENLSSLSPDDIFICSVVRAELFYGAHKSNNPEKTLTIQNEFCNRFKSLYFDDEAASVYGEIRSELEKRGNVIGPNDLMIASIAIANNLTLVSHNSREFGRIKGLKFVDWEE
jgi:tRNA(fMet)-specific endonuclease VapC